MKLHALRDQLDSAEQRYLASCAEDGTPHISSVSVTQYAGPDRLALSCEAFDTTYRNLRRNPHAALMLQETSEHRSCQISLRLHHVETEGPLFEHLRARLDPAIQPAAINDQPALICADIHEVLSIDTHTASDLPAATARQEHLLALRNISLALANAEELSQALDHVLDGLAAQLEITNSLILCMDESGQWLYTVASRGYTSSGVGSEVALGEGLIGLAAQYRTPMRRHQQAAALRPAGRPAATEDALAAYPADPAIPLPTLAHSRCQIAVPILAGNWLGGVLYAESVHTPRFSVDDEDALTAIASQLAMAMRLLLRQPEPGMGTDTARPVSLDTSTDAVSVRYYAANQSLFFGDDYLIKGVAGAILWLMLGDYQRDGRQDFSNRELRMDARLRLPELDDNLETRLLLLQRRLAERCDWLRIDRPARGRLRLVVARPMLLQQVDAAH
ncbi:GAF domain-containing protein [Chitinimonas sp. BJYL2]|uniref:GAF domain-containing protein n=1 Tax=Chitinimonas sp. BJYL2 TaxID=2976696 RepID=UPI0022B35585|nr:GAF domain-containing protein [Chitinimonas sp. BJYL2]